MLWAHSQGWTPRNTFLTGFQNGLGTQNAERFWKPGPNFSAHHAEVKPSTQIPWEDVPLHLTFPYVLTEGRTSTAFARNGLF